MTNSYLNFGQLLDKLKNAEIKNKPWLYEKTKKALFLVNYGIIYNQICLNGLAPIFTDIYLYIYDNISEIFRYSSRLS